MAPSRVGNNFIDFTAQGFMPDTAMAGSLAAEWITKFNPEETVNGFSHPIQLYNTNTSRFLSDSEEITEISDTTNKIGSIAGSLNFESSDISPSFTFKRIQDNIYQIYKCESENNSLNNKRLLIDTINLSRIIITSENIIKSVKIDDTWQIIHLKD